MNNSANILPVQYNRHCSEFSLKLVVYQPLGTQNYCSTNDCRRIVFPRNPTYTSDARG